MISFFNLYVDLVDACNLACRTCPRGLRVMRNKRGQMPLPMFKELLKKAKKFGISVVGLYDWSEPFLTHNLECYTKAVKGAGFTCEISSNLSFKSLPNLIETLKYVDRLYVSVSGFTQKTYSINHYGGNVEYVKRNLTIIGDALKKGDINTRVDIRYFDFPYTLEEYPLFKGFAEELGINPVLMKAHGNPAAASRSITPSLATMSLYNVISNPPYNLSSAACRYLESLTINSKGDAYLCCATVNDELTYIGNAFELDFDTIQLKRFIHSYCRNCGAVLADELDPAASRHLGNALQRHLVSSYAPRLVKFDDSFSIPHSTAQI